MSIAYLGQVDHDLDDLVHHLPLREVVQDLYSTDPFQQTRAAAVHTSCRLYGSHAATLTYVDHTDQVSIWAQGSRSSEESMIYLG